MVSWSMLGSLFVPYISALVIILVTFVLAWLVNLIIPRLVRQSSPQMGVAARRLGVAVVALIGGTLAVQALGVSPGILLLVIAMVGVAILLALWAPWARRESAPGRCPGQAEEEPAWLASRLAAQHSRALEPRTRRQPEMR